MSKPKPKGTNDNVKVMVRVRPFNKKEIEENGGEIPFCTVNAREGIVQTTDPFAPEVTNLNTRQEFAFDHVFWSIPEDQLITDVPFATQEEVFEHAGIPSLESFFDGYNGCIFAYGQTSSGKTYTMMGYHPPEEQRGLIPRLCEMMFDRIEDAEEACKDMQMSQGKIRKVSHNVTLTYLEIYNEKVVDLLLPRNKQNEELKVQYDPITGPTVKGLKIVDVSSWKDVKHQFKIGNEHRHTAATAMNDTSSRSHAVVMITMTQREVMAMIKGKPKIVTRQSRINLIDLAGSEKVQKSMVTGVNLKEAIGINQSLTCLGRVIDGLVKGEKHVPYRDSVLTQLLSDSLGGNSRTTMLATISPAAVNYDETVSTLRYASRARQIVNVVRINEDPTAQLIRELQEELAQLKLAGLGVGGAAYAGPGGNARAAAEAHEVEEMLAQLEGREKQAQKKLELQEKQWARERDFIEQGHQRAVNQLQDEKDALMLEQQQLHAKTAKLESDVAQQRRQRDLMEKEHADAQAEASAKQNVLRRQRIIDRFRLASDKSRQNAARAEVGKELAELRQKYEALQKAIVQRDRELAQRPPKNRGMYIGQSIDKDSGAVICEMCYECNALVHCMDCGGDYLCELCDLNQHRSPQTQAHLRSTLNTGGVEGVILCEFCNLKRATFTCLECINGRLCEDCNDIKHRNRKRNFHHVTPGLAVSLGMDEASGHRPRRTMIDELYHPPNPSVVPRQRHTIATPTFPYTQISRLEGGIPPTPPGYAQPGSVARSDSYPAYTQPAYPVSANGYPIY